MTIFVLDTSTQTTAGIGSNNRFTSQSIPNIRFNATSGIYNPSLDNIRIFTNNTDALTIDSSQVLTGNGSGLTNISYSNVINKPTNFQSDYNSTVINKPDLSIYQPSLTFNSPLTKTGNTVSLDLSSYLTTATAGTTYATIANLNAKENTLTFSAPLTRTLNTISLDLSTYDTITARNAALASYLTTATAGTTYATITNLNLKENALTFSAPLTRTTNTISLDLSTYDTITARNAALASYLTTATAGTTYATITNLNLKENALTFSAPLTRTTNTISLDLSTYDTITARNAALASYLTTATAGTTYATITNLNLKENALTFSAPLTRTTNTIGIDLSGYQTTASLGTTYLKVDGTNSMTGTLNLSSTTQSQPRLILSGQEFYQAANSLTSGIALLCGVNRAGNKQLWVADSSNLIQNTTTPVLRIFTQGIDCVATNGINVLPISFGNSGATTTINGSLISLTGNTIIGSPNNTNCKLYVSAQIATVGTCFPMRICAGAAADTNANATIFGLGTENNGWSKSGIAHVRTGPYDQGDIVFLNRNTIDSNDCNLSYERMRIYSGGGVNINGNFTCQSTLTTNTSNSNVLVSYFLPTPYSNGSTPTNQATTSTINLCTSTTAGFAVTSPYLSVKCSDIANAFGTVVTLSSQGNYWSGSNWSNSIVLDSSYNTNGPGPSDGGTITFNSGSRTMCTINRNGLGILTNSPQTELDVRGKIYIGGSVNVNTPQIAQFGGSGDRLILWNGSSTQHPYSLGINGGTMWYSVPNGAIHAFHINGGEIIRFNSTGMGFGNTNPQSYMHLGNVDVAGSAPILLFGKRLSNNSGFRTAFIGYNDSFYFCIGDAGNVNSSPSITQQLKIVYSAPASTLTLEYDGRCYSLQFINTSDERIKTDIYTIENALEKTLLLRGVSYRIIQEDFKAIGLIAQEVENIIPEVVSTNSETGLKGIDYSGLVGLLVEAIKDQQKQINELKNILIKNNLI